ncbi:MAG TPA: uroporphyrinogen decarboxylase [Candidatus Limnocylindrales bacterium]|nr:uroporphyrinogen decarboxylase [Candidatus Limnocylindrales bacterium]
MTGAERFLAGCRGAAVDATPVWFMRQAGGSLPAYLALRKRHSVIEIARDARLCSEVSAGAADALGTDAAIMFADIMLLAEAMGVALELRSDGPHLEHPIRSLADVERLRVVDPAGDLGFILEAIRATRLAVGSSAAVIGLAGGPFTMAAYLIEGGPSRDHAVAKTMLFAAPEVWHALVDRITHATVAYVRAQVAAGAEAIQLFDSWAGSLGPADYDRAVRPWTARVLDAIRDAGVPSIHYAASGAALLERLADGADVVGVDAGQSLAVARARLGPDRAVQGNLDPARLLAGPRAIESGVTAVLEAADGAPGHIFNTGGPIARETSPDALRSIVAMVHDRSAREMAAAAGRHGQEVPS